MIFLKSTAPSYVSVMVSNSVITRIWHTWVYQSSKGICAYFKFSTTYSSVDVESTGVLHPKLAEAIRQKRDLFCYMAPCRDDWKGRGGEGKLHTSDFARNRGHYQQQPAPPPYIPPAGSDASTCHGLGVPIFADAIHPFFLRTSKFFLRLGCPWIFANCRLRVGTPQIF